MREANMTPKYGNTCCSVLPLANNVRSQSEPSDCLPLQASLKPRPVFSSSDYDAFDHEDDEPGEDEEDEEDEKEDEESNASDNRPVYSDFRMLSSSESDEEFGDASYSFDTLDTSYHLGIDYGEKAINLVMENERQDEVSVAPAIPENLRSSFSSVIADGV